MTLAGRADPAWRRPQPQELLLPDLVDVLPDDPDEEPDEEDPDDESEDLPEPPVDDASDFFLSDLSPDLAPDLLDPSPVFDDDVEPPPARESVR